MSQTTDLTVTNNTAENRFETTVDGYLSKIDYRRYGDDKIAYVHTEVPPELEGRGIASKMVRVALQYVRDHQLKLMPLCPFVKSYLQRHRDEWNDLTLIG